MLETGQTVPAFSRPATGDKTLSLETFANQFLVLYFYPRDSTPGCTKEGLAFTEMHSEFQALNCEIVGVSRDSLRKHENFKQKQGFSFDLISDEDESLCQLFDVIKEKTLYGKKHMGIERSTFLIDPDSRLIAEWRKVKVPGHVEAVLQTLRKLIG